MKRLLFLLPLMILAWMPLYSQTVLFYEDFENVTASGMTSSGVPGWGNSSILFAGGLKSDSATCFNAGDSSVLMVTNAFNTSAFGYVMLEFDHICKIEFYDAAYIEVSANNGSSWIRLTGSQYLGSGQFASSGDKFNSTSYVDWLPGNPTPPSNTW